MEQKDKDEIATNIQFLMDELIETNATYKKSITKEFVQMGSNKIRTEDGRKLKLEADFTHEYKQMFAAHLKKLAYEKELFKTKQKQFHAAFVAEFKIPVVLPGTAESYRGRSQVRGDSRYRSASLPPGPRPSGPDKSRGSAASASTASTSSTPILPPPKAMTQEEKAKQVEEQKEKKAKAAAHKAKMDEVTEAAKKEVARSAAAYAEFAKLSDESEKKEAIAKENRTRVTYTSPHGIQFKPKYDHILEHDGTGLVWKPFVKPKKNKSGRNR